MASRARPTPRSATRHAAAVPDEAEWRQVFNLIRRIANTNNVADLAGIKDEDRRRTQEAFKSFDTNNDSLISRDELRTLFAWLDPIRWNAESLDRLFRAADLDKDGMISYDEFLAWVFADEETHSLIESALQVREGTIKSCTKVDRTSADELLHASEFENLQTILASDALRERGIDRGRKATKEVRFLSLLSEADFAGRSSSLDFHSFVVWLGSLLRRAVRDRDQRKKLLVEGVAALKALETRVGSFAAVERSNVFSTLEKALAAAQTVCSECELTPHYSRLEELKLPFNVKLSTLGGIEHEVEVWQGQTVQQLRSLAAELFGRESHLIQMVVAGGALDFNDAPLDSFGILAHGHDIAVSFMDEETWQEEQRRRLFLGLFAKYHLPLNLHREIDTAITVMTSEFNSVVTQLSSLPRWSHTPLGFYMHDPPRSIDLLAQALCIMFQEPVIKVAAPDGRGKVDHYWCTVCGRLFRDRNFYNTLINYDKENIPDAVIDQILPLFSDPFFNAECVGRSATESALVVYKWVQTMVVYNGLMRVTRSL